MRRSLVVSLLFFIPAYGFGIDLEPWYHKMFEIRPQLDIAVEHSPSFSVGNHTRTKRANAVFVKAGVEIPYYSWEGQCEILLAKSTYRNYGVDSFLATIRYQLLDDVALESPVSLVVSGTIVAATRAALDDPCSFHHGKFEGIFHLSVGKEWDCDQFWNIRLWGGLGVGCADVGSTWWHGVVCAEKNFFDRYRCSLFLDGLFGMGKNNLHPSHFHGYGPVAHRSMDLGGKCFYHCDIGAILAATYSYRVFARNFPQYTSSFLVEFVYPFGL